MLPGRLVPKGLTNLQTKSQTNQTAQDDIRDHKLTTSRKIGELERTLSYQTTRASMETSCTGNRTVEFESHPLPQVPVRRQVLGFVRR